MPTDIPPHARELLATQGDLIARSQGTESGVAPHTMRNLVRNGRWQRLQRGVYATFSGDPARETVLWGALGDADEGVLSVLEYRYVRGVERPHGLPAARRQARIRQRTGNRYLDNLYESYGVCVELDGTAAHPGDEQWRDKRRDNANLFGGIVTLRFGILELGEHRCESAAYVAAVLSSHGWPGTPHPCPRPPCTLRPRTS